MKGTASVYGGVQVLVPWHMMNVPEPVQSGSLLPERLQVPTTIPLLNVPVVDVVPLDVPVSPSVLVKESTVPGAVVDFTVKVRPPVTAPEPVVFRVAVPVSVSASFPVAKHAPSLKNPKPVISKGCGVKPVVLVTLKDVTKFSWLAGPIPPIIWASQLPLLVVVTVVSRVLFPQPHTASSSASTIRASFFMYLPSVEVLMRIERCGQGRQWM
jgi:hypothetical protein